MNKKDYFKPDFIGVGAPRCGTTWIYDCLSEHPEICTSDIKETNFFKENYDERNSFEKYKDHFSHCSDNKIKGEFSSSYFHSQDALARIKNVYPDVKIILSLRSVVDKLITSFYDRNRHKKNLTKKDFDKFFKKRFFGKDVYFYSDKVKFILDTFDEDRLHIIIFKDLKDNPEETIKNLYSFLGVKEDFIPKTINEKSNKIDSFYFPRVIKFFHKIYNSAKRNHSLYLVLRKLRLFTLGRKLIDLLGKRRKRSLASNKEFKKKLFQSFEKDTERLEKMLDEDLEHWKY